MEKIEIQVRQGGKTTKALKLLQSEYNILKIVHTKIVNELADIKVKEYELKKSVLEGFATGRRDALREVLDALYENEFDELCITQKQYKKWEDELLD